MPGPKTGHSMKLYRNTGTVAVPVWTEVAEVGDVSLDDLVRGVAELKRRGNQYTKALASLIQLASITFRMHSGLAATVYTAIRTAFFAGTVEEYLIFDGAVATSGNQGFRMPALVTDFPWNQPLEDVAGHDIKVSLAYMESAGAEVEPSWMIIP